MFKLSFLLILVGMLSSCAGLFPGRTYIDEMDRESEGMWTPGEDFSMVAGDSGEAFRTHDEITKRTPATAYSREQMEYERTLNMQLKQKISTLDEQSYAIFKRDRALLGSISEQIYYLDLSPSERASYVALKREGSNKMDKDKPYAYLGNYQDSKDLSLRSYFDSRYERQALHLGMSKQEVISTWGEPLGVDFAGDPKLQNERWSFRQQGKVHHVYFEAGKVQGWDLN